MKTKRTKDRKSGSATLVVRPTKREQLVYSQAEWLVSRPHPNLAAFRYTLDGDEPTLYYDVTDLTDLKSYAKAPFGLAQYQALLVALGEVIDLCTRRDLPTSALQLDVDQVFVNADGAVQFVFVPLSGVPASKTGTAGALLQWLAQTGAHGNVRFVVPDDARHAEALFDYAKRNPVFSLADYKAFLSSEFGVAAKGAPPAPKDVAGGRGASGGLADRRARAGAAVPAPAAFDPVALLYRAPSASEVVAGQGIADRVRGAVADVSPTAAPQPVVTGSAASVPSAPAPQPASPAPPAPASQPAAPSAPSSAQPAAPQAADQVEAPAPPQAAARVGEPASPHAAGQVETPAPPEPAARVETPAAPAPAPAPVPGTSVSSVPAPQPTPPASPAEQPAPPAPRPAAPAAQPAAPAPSGGTSLLGAGVVSRAGSSLASGFAPADCYLERTRDGARYRISGAATSVLGRSSSCDVKIDGNSNVSRAHAQVRRVGASFEVVDLGSSNGTFVQGRRLSKGQAATVALGEAFELADETLRFVDR